MTNKTKWMIAGGVVLLLAIAAIVWRVYVKHRMLTPSETLQQLEATSQPVTATPQEKQEELDSLKKQSTPPTTTVDIRQQMLGKLH